MTYSKHFHSVFKLTYHLILVTKYRRKCITKEILLRLEIITQNLCNTWRAKLIEFNGEQDHVHLLIELHPGIKPSSFVNNIKTVTARIIRNEFENHLNFYYHKPCFWSRSYCIISCGGAPLTIIKQYIQQQDAPQR